MTTDDWGDPWTIEDLGDAYLQHYERYFRRPVEVQSFKAFEGPQIQMLAYDKVFKKCRVFASLGLTHFSKQVDGIAEVYMPVDAAWDSAPHILANILFQMVKHQTSIGWGVSMAGVELMNREFVEQYNKTAVYFTRPYGLPSEFSHLKFGNEDGNMYLAMFLSKLEHDYFADHGARMFEAMLQEKGVDPYDVRRTSCI